VLCAEMLGDSLRAAADAELFENALGDCVALFA
jgi:hypothetical protein